MSKPNKLIPLVISDALPAIKAFYVDRIGARTVFDFPEYLQVRFGDDDGDPELAFMRTTGAPQLGPQEAFAGKGIIVSILVENADTHHRALVERGVAIELPPSDKPWGWRSFTARDPSGVVLDFFHALAEAPAKDATG
jgi:uncharacterized glyoxalase superfamily protein PhnB